MDSIIEINTEITTLLYELFCSQKPQVLTDSKFNAVVSILDYRGK